MPEVTLLLMTFQWLMVHVWLMVSHNEFMCISDLFATSFVRYICEFCHANMSSSSSLLFVPVDV